MAHTLHALLSLCAAVEAAAAVILVCLPIDAPISAAGPAFGAGANLVVPPPYAVPRTALGVPAAFPPQTPAIVVGPGHPRNGGQSGPKEGASHPPYGLAPGEGARCEPLC